MRPRRHEDVQGTSGKWERAETQTQRTQANRKTYLTLRVPYNTLFIVSVPVRERVEG
jgi:hypothetical protein